MLIFHLLESKRSEDWELQHCSFLQYIDAALVNGVTDGLDGHGIIYSGQLRGTWIF